MSRKRGRRAPAPSPAPSPPSPAARPGRGRRIAVAALVVGAGVAGAWILAGGRPARSAGGAAHPNVLLVTIDTLRADRLGCYGYAGAATPALDALAARGRALRRRRSRTRRSPRPRTRRSSPASRRRGTACATTAGVRAAGAGRPWPRPSAPRATRPARSCPASRSTVASASAAGSTPTTTGCRTATTRGARPTSSGRREGTTAAALAWLDALPAGAALVPLGALLRSPRALRAARRRCARASPAGPTTARWPSSTARSAVLLRRLDERGSRARTAVLVTADHGESLGEHGEETHGVFVYDATLRVPWIVAGAGRRRTGRVSARWRAASTSRRRCSTWRT